MTKFEVTEDNFIKKSTSSYDLSILIGVDRFSYVVNDAQQNILILKSFTYRLGKDHLKSAIREIYMADRYLKFPYSKVKVAIVNAQTSLVPSRLYDEKQKSIYLEKMTFSENLDTIKADHLLDFNAVNVYSFDREAINLLKGYFPSAQIFHNTTALIQGYYKQSEALSGPKIFINVLDKIVQAVILEDKELIFCNSFTYKSSKDFIYYIMLLFDQFNLKPETVPLTISGHIIEDSEVYHLLYKYIRHLNMIGTPSYFKIGKKLSDIPQHIYFDLFSLKLCE